MDLTTQELALIGEGAHTAILECNIARGDYSLPSWDSANNELRASTITGVETCLKGATPRQQHEQWMATRVANGWKWGPETDRANKINSALMDYDSMPEWQRVKDEVFQGAVRAGAAIVLRLRNG